MNKITTGSRRIVCNVWSDAAREASAESRKEFLKNPSASDLRSKLKESAGGHLRGIARGKDVFWFDAYHSTHADFQNTKLGGGRPRDTLLNVHLISGHPVLQGGYGHPRLKNIEHWRPHPNPKDIVL